MHPPSEMAQAGIKRLVDAIKAGDAPQEPAPVINSALQP